MNRDKNDKLLKEKQSIDTKNGEDSYHLYTERIVEKVTVKHRKLFNMIKFIAAAVAFGVIAAFSMMVINPWIQERFGDRPNNRTPLTVSKDEYLDEDNINSGDDNAQSHSSADQKTTEISYSQIRQKALKSIVKIDYRGGKGDADSQENEDVSYGMGVIIGDIDQEYLILADRKYADASSEFEINICDNIWAPGKKLSEDENSGYMVLTVLKSDIKKNIYNQLSGYGNLYITPESTGGVTEEDISTYVKNKVRAATLGNSYSLHAGTRIIAVGITGDGYEDAVQGVITDIDYKSSVDITFDIMNTNIENNRDSLGFLFGPTGNLVGIAGGSENNDVINIVDENTVDAEDDASDDAVGKIIENPTDDTTGKSDKLAFSGISSLKPVIEVMSRGGKAAYFGIEAANVTASMSEKYKIPQGIYVTNVIIDSPAYNAGIQAGDVITGFNSQDVQTIQLLTQKIYECNENEGVIVRVKRFGNNNYRDLVFTFNLSVR